MLSSQPSRRRRDMRRRGGIEDLRSSYTYSHPVGPAFALRLPIPQHTSPFSSTTETTATIPSDDYAPRWRKRSSSRERGGGGGAARYGHGHGHQYGDNNPPWFASVCVQTVDQIQEAAMESFPGRRASRWSHRTALIVPDLSTEVARSVSWRSAGPLIVCFRVRRYDYDADLRFDDAVAWRRIRQLAAEKGADGVERQVEGIEGRLLVCWIVKRQGRIIDPRLEFPYSGDDAFERRRERRDAVSAGLSSLLAGPYQYSRDYDIINEPNPLAYLFLPNPYKLPP